MPDGYGLDATLLHLSMSLGNGSHRWCQMIEGQRVGDQHLCGHFIDGPQPLVFVHADHRRFGADKQTHTLCDKLFALRFVEAALLFSCGDQFG